MARWTPSGKMRFAISIERAEVSGPNEYGELFDFWLPLADLYASLDELSSREYFAARAIQSAATHSIRCRYVPGVTVDMRIRRSFGAGLPTPPDSAEPDRLMYILSVRNIEHANRELEILAVEKLPEDSAPPLYLDATGVAPRIVARLVGTAAVAAIVDTRVRPLKLHQSDTYPAIVYRMNSSSPLNTAGGEDPSGTETASFTIESIARSYADARALAKAVRGDGSGATGLSGWSDRAGNPPVSMCHLDPDADGDVDLDPGQDAGFYSVAQTYFINYAKP